MSEQMKSQDTTLYRVDNLLLCGQCLDGAGGMCWNPGCAMIRNTAPDIPLRPNAEAMGAVIRPIEYFEKGEG